MNKLAALLMAGIFSTASFAALAADEPTAPTETAKQEAPEKAQKHEHKHKHDHMKKETKEDKKDDTKEVSPESAK